MYDNFKILNYNNSLVSPELFARHLSRLTTGNVLDGLNVVPKTGLTITVKPGNGLIPYGSGATSSVRMMSLVADFDITLDTADASNPRIDLIVIYVKTDETLPGGTPTAANIDGPGIVRATFVKGTPNASPVAPTVGAIQTKIGAANQYFVTTEVRVDAGVMTIASNKVTDRRVMVGPSASVAAAIPANTITNAMLSTAAGELGGAWKDYVPTLAGFTLGNGTMRARYLKLGKTYIVRVAVTSGTTSATTNPIVISNPVPSITYISAEPMGTGKYKAFHGPVVWNDANTVTLRWYSAQGSGTAESAITSTSPDVLGGANQTWYATWTYEAA